MKRKADVNVTMKSFHRDCLLGINLMVDGLRYLKCGNSEMNMDFHEIYTTAFSIPNEKVYSVMDTLFTEARNMVGILVKKNPTIIPSVMDQLLKFGQDIRLPQDFKKAFKALVQEVKDETGQVYELDYNKTWEKFDYDYPAYSIIEKIAKFHELELSRADKIRLATDIMEIVDKERQDAMVVMLKAEDHKSAIVTYTDDPQFDTTEMVKDYHLKTNDIYTLVIE